MRVVVLGVVIGLIIVIGVLYYTGLFGSSGGPAEPASQGKGKEPSQTQVADQLEGQVPEQSGGEVEEPIDEGEPPASFDEGAEPGLDQAESAFVDEADDGLGTLATTEPWESPAPEEMGEAESMIGEVDEGIADEASVGTLASRRAILDSIPPLHAEEEAKWKLLLSEKVSDETLKTYPYYGCFEMSAAKNKLPEVLLIGLALHLSNFDPNSSINGKMGVMHVGWPFPASEMGITREKILVKHPCQNIELGAAFLAKLLERSGGEYVPALVAYRAQSPEIHVERLSNKDLEFSERLRASVEKAMDEAFEGERKYAFRSFDRKAVAERFMESIRRRSGVSLTLGQESGRYVLYIVAKDEVEMKRLADTIFEKTGIKMESE